jgi:hypothetical protein
MNLKDTKWTKPVTKEQMLYDCLLWTPKNQIHRYRKNGDYQDWGLGGKTWELLQQITGVIIVTMANFMLYALHDNKTKKINWQYKKKKKS